MEQAIRKNPDVVLIDEVGPMEMTNRGFRAALSELLSSKMIVIATVKQGSYYPEVETIMANPGTVKMEISKETREQDFERITSIVDTWIGERNKPI
jgi:nucleoside-triphosphatase THEP1